MTVQEMHYDFKMKLNKIDSQQYRNLRIQEIDWLLNEAQELFVKKVAFPRLYQITGFETSQRNIDDIRTLVVEDKEIDVVNNYVALPDEYMFFVRGYVNAKKGNCKVRKCRLIIRQHDDMFQESPYDESSYEWGEINGTFDMNGIRVYPPKPTNDTPPKVTTLSKAYISYIKKPALIHNAQDVEPDHKYKLPNEVELTGRQNSELPQHTHREIVDIAVLIASNNLDMPNFQYKQAKLNMNQFV